MIPLLIAAGWMFVLLVVVAMCATARRGDGESVTPSALSGIDPARLEEWESAENLAVYAYTAGAVRPAAQREHTGEQAPMLARAGRFSA
jgi:hypothetical protein